MTKESEYWDARAHEKLDKNKYRLEDRADLDEIKKLGEWVGALMAAQDDKEFIILEVGPGFGNIYKYILSCFPDEISPDNYKMVDIAPALAGYCYKFTGNKPFVMDDPTLIPMATNSVDLVISHSVLMHVPPEQCEKLFAEMVRVSRKYVYIGEYMGDKKLAEHNYKHDYLNLFMQHDLRLMSGFSGETEGRVCWLVSKEDDIKMWNIFQQNTYMNSEMEQALKDMVIGLGRIDPAREKKNEKNVGRGKK